MKYKNNKFKLKNKNLIFNKIKISNYYIFDFFNDWAVILDLKTRKQGWISSDFSKIINPIYDECRDFREEIAIFRKNNKEGYLTKNGKILIDDLDYCGYFKNGYARFIKDGINYWIDKTGKIYEKDPS